MNGDPTCIQQFKPEKHPECIKGAKRAKGNFFGNLSGGGRGLQGVAEGLLVTPTNVPLPSAHQTLRNQNEVAPWAGPGNGEETSVSTGWWLSAEGRAWQDGESERQPGNQRRGAVRQ